MQQRQVIVIGAGFAGLAAVRELEPLSRERGDITVRLFDAHPYTTMVPSLPDLAGGRLAQAVLTGHIERLLGPGVTFHAERVDAIDLDEKCVIVGESRYAYDALVLAAGSVTNLFSFDQALEAVHTLDSIDDANRIRQDFAEYMRQSERPLAVVVGGGYTGMELACNIQFAGRSFDPPPKVCVVELKDRILPFMPERVRDYMERQAKRRGIELILGASVERFDGANVVLSNSRRLEDVFLCWSTGTRFALDDIRGDCERIRDGRLVVQADLSLPGHPDVYAAGDAAAIQHKGQVLRKAVNFARDSGRRAGLNIRRTLEGEGTKPYRPVDLGWVIPFCDVGVGKLFERLPVRGRLPLALHYAMCGLRNYSLSNRLFYWKIALAALGPRRLS